MATFKFNLPLNTVESIKYALIQVFNSFYQSVFVKEIISSMYGPFFSSCFQPHDTSYDITLV